MTTLFCPRCKTNVLARREEINWCVLIILAIFTAGFGVLIYLAIYYNKPETQCVHCHSTCKPQVVEQPQPQVLVNPYHVGVQTQVVQVEEEDKEEGAKFCPNCGVKFERTGGKFCAFCGTSI